MIKKISWVLFAMVICFIIYREYYTRKTEEIRENFEEGKYCESFDDLKIITFLSSEYKPLLGASYARGLCVSQDINKAKEIYGQINKNESSKIAIDLFYDGIEIAAEDGRNNHPLRIDKIRPLFLESKQLGIILSQKEVDALSQYNLNNLFKDL